MKSFKLIAFLFAITTMQTTNLSAQNNNESELLTVSEITVKHGHNAQFIEGVKKWKECYLENNGTDNWNIWRRVQGEGTVYVLTGLMANWAEMDKEDPAGKECYTTVLNFIMPHVEKTNYNIARTMPEHSTSFPEDTKLVWVTFFKVKNSVDFMEIVKTVGDAIKAKEGKPRGIWYNYAGGAQDSPDYMVSTPLKGYADLDISRDNPAKVYEDAAGKKKTDEMRAKWRGAVGDEWSYIYTLNSELSN